MPVYGCHIVTFIRDDHTESGFVRNGQWSEIFEAKGLAEAEEEMGRISKKLLGTIRNHKATTRLFRCEEILLH